MPSNPDWVCSDPRCGNVNLFKKERCVRCDKRRKSAHSTGSSRDRENLEKNKGLFSPDDWSCRNCGNVNWARRSTCNICNTPKVNTLGERTGYGGGFMERDEVVEYRDRSRDNASDDEFDEFGRIKKPFRKSVADDKAKASVMQQSGTVAVSSKEKEGEDEDDDEEESGDDADLSKYDIWGENDEADSPSNPTGRASGARSSAHDETSNSSTSGSDLASSSTSSSSSSGSSQSPRRHKRSRDSSLSKSRSPDSRENGKSTDSPRHTSGSIRRRLDERDRSRSPL